MHGDKNSSLIKIVGDCDNDIKDMRAMVTEHKEMLKRTIWPSLHGNVELR